MSRGRTQKGAGFFNRIRSMFRTRKVAPAPVINQTERRSNTKHETLADALKRDFVFLYYKLHGQEPPREKRFVSPQQEAEVKRVLLDADARGLSADDIIRQIFHRSDTKAFDDEFSAWEQYLPEKYLNKGTEYERQAFDVAGGLERLIATLKIKKTPRNIAYASNFQTHICDSNNLNEPVKSLGDESCFTILTPQNQEMFEAGKGYAYPVSYILIQKQFFPSGAAGPIALNARSLPALSFVLDAFQQNGVLEIEPTLKATLEREAPELLSLSQQKPIVVFIPFYLRDPSVTQGQFLVVDPSVLSRGRNVVNVKDLRSSDLIQTAFARQKVLFMDPKTMFEIRDKIPQLWLASFGSFNTNVFKTLTPHEKLAFCFLQYAKFQEVYSLHRNARNLNNESAVARKTFNAAEEAKRTVFAANYAAGANPYELAENFGVDDTENLRQLVKIQEDVLGSATIRTPNDVRRLLSKFDTRRSVSSGPVVVNYFGPSRVNLGKNVKTLATASRKQRVKQMLTPRNIQQQRNNILRRYKEAMAMPKKRSMLPNFLRTKKARQANKKQYYNRLQTLTNELREFNERHGIQTKSGYGYEF